MIRNLNFIRIVLFKILYMTLVELSEHLSPNHFPIIINCVLYFFEGIFVWRDENKPWPYNPFPWR